MGSVKEEEEEEEFAFEDVLGVQGSPPASEVQQDQDVEGRRGRGRGRGAAPKRSRDPAGAGAEARRTVQLAGARCASFAWSIP